MYQPMFNEWYYDNYLIYLKISECMIYALVIFIFYCLLLTSIIVGTNCVIPTP